MMVTMPDFPAPGPAADQVLLRSIEISALRPAFNSPSSTGWTMEVFSVPGQAISPACAGRFR